MGLLPGTSWTIEGRATVTVAATSADLCRQAADAAAAALRAAVAERGRAHAMFATGNSQLGMIDALVNHTADVPWDKTVVFHMDEYLGVSDDHPASFCRWIRQRIVEPARPEAAHLLDGTLPADEACAAYSRLLATHPLDLCCLGIGENGHLAFNDPPVADFDDPVDVKVVVLDERCRLQQVGEGHFAAVADVPGQAITVTIPALLRARRVLAIAPDARKAEAVRDALSGPVSTSCPASALQYTPQASIYLDGDSAGLLPAGWPEAANHRSRKG
ncbi:MAG: 6-phosphogluconolactonase [Acidimicrobiales bacterium]